MEFRVALEHTFLPHTYWLNTNDPCTIDTQIHVSHCPLWAINLMKSNQRRNPRQFHQKTFYAHRHIMHINSYSIIWRCITSNLHICLIPYSNWGIPLLQFLSHFTPNPKSKSSRGKKKKRKRKNPWPTPNPPHHHSRLVFHPCNDQILGNLSNYPNIFICPSPLPSMQQSNTRSVGYAKWLKKNTSSRTIRIWIHV